MAGIGEAARAETEAVPQDGGVEIVPAQLTTEAPDAQSGVLLGFEDGFALELPAGWKRYVPDAEMRENDISYCLSDADGTRWLYIQKWESDCTDIEALNRQIAEEAEENHEILVEKPVQLAVEEFTNNKYKMVEPPDIGKDIE